jgi:pilus biogenesis lipoprotein CpaD
MRWYPSTSPLAAPVGTLLLLGLAACAALEPLPPPDPPKQLSLAPTTRAHAVHFATDIDEPSAEERQRLQAFLDGLAPAARHEIRLAGHADDRASDAYNLDLSARRAASVARLIRGAGLTDALITTSAFGERAPARAGTGEPVWSRNRRVEVAVEGWAVTLPGCPDWSRDVAHDPLNLPMSNLGCATLGNLARMIADPADLAQGRRLGPADATREAEAVVRYRAGKVKALEGTVVQP